MAILMIQQERRGCSIPFTCMNLTLIFVNTYVLVP
jgi:hypothetical protein